MWFIGFGIALAMTPHDPSNSGIGQELWVEVEQTSLYAQTPVISERARVIALISQYSKEFGVDFDLAYTIAELESDFVVTAKNPHSSASGVFQFVASTWQGYCSGNVFNADDNVRCALKLLAERNGIKYWLADKSMVDRLRLRGYVFN